MYSLCTSWLIHSCSFHSLFMLLYYYWRLHSSWTRLFVCLSLSVGLAIIFNVFISILLTFCFLCLCSCFCRVCYMYVWVVMFTYIFFCLLSRRPPLDCVPLLLSFLPQSTAFSLVISIPRWWNLIICSNILPVISSLLLGVSILITIHLVNL